MNKSDQIISGFIIKSQDLGEADLLLTFFSETEGKVRAVVKSAKKMTSRLSGNLQPYILVQVTLVGEGSLQKVITVQPLARYVNIISSMHGMNVLLAMQELVLRSLADGQPNEQLFAIYHDSLQSLNSGQSEIAVLTKFYVESLQAIGFAPRLAQAEAMYFSLKNGQFSNQYEDSGDVSVSTEAYQIYKSMLSRSFDIPSHYSHEQEPAIRELLSLLTRFASYQLERELKATLYFTIA